MTTYHNHRPSLLVVPYLYIMRTSAAYEHMAGIFMNDLVWGNPSTLRDKTHPRLA